MRINLRHVFYIWGTILIFLVAIGFLSHQRLNPKKLVSDIQTSLKDQGIYFEFDMNQIGYSYSTSFKIKINKLLINSSETSKLQINHLELKIPWWVVLFQKGEIHFNVSGLEVFPVGDTNLKNSNKNEVLSTQPILDITKIRLNIPEFFLNSKIHFKLENLIVFKDDHKTHAFIVNKLLIRNFSLSKKSAFEINIPASIKSESFSSKINLWFFGELFLNNDLWHIKYRGDLTFVETVPKSDFDKLQMDGSAFFQISPLRAELNSEIYHEGRKVAVINSHSVKNNLEAKIRLNKFDKNYFQALTSKVYNSLSASLAREGEVSGEISYLQSQGQSQPIITYNLSATDKLQMDDLEVFGLWEITHNNRFPRIVFKSDANNLVLRRDINSDQLWNIEINNNVLVNSTWKLCLDFLTMQEECEVVVKDTSEQIEGKLRVKNLNGSKESALELTSANGSINATKSQSVDSEKLKIISKDFNPKNINYLWSPFLKTVDAQVTGTVLYGGVDEIKEWSVNIQLSSIEELSGMLMDEILKLLKNLALTLPSTPNYLRAKISKKNNIFLIEELTIKSEKYDITLMGEFHNEKLSKFKVKDNWNKKSFVKTLNLSRTN